MRSITRKALLLAAFAACVGGLGSRVSAQDMLIATVPFKFTVAGKAYDPGKYEIQVNSEAQMIELFGAGRNSGMAEVLTRLEPHGTTTDAGRLVFDNVDGVYVLSEMWLPDEDGFLLHSTPAAHTHRAVSIHSTRS
jgi:hypothetical protein